MVASISWGIMACHSTPGKEVVPSIIRLTWITIPLARLRLLEGRMSQVKKRITLKTRIKVETIKVAPILKGQ